MACRGWTSKVGTRQPACSASFVGRPSACTHNWDLLLVPCAAAEATVQQDIVAEEAAALAEAGTCSPRPACQSSCPSEPLVLSPVLLGPDCLLVMCVACRHAHHRWGKASRH